ncbi:MAG: MutT/nudix family protein [Parcubacteria group bacterium GW2011_GWA2_47_8b]|uniref:MutT/nudix family protein n=3 Tax=Parcubacteria group TaxID=1794811 RepID=A0A0G1T6B1_9BACT|nr:MAG: MutT/nudix family protein [Candidatus Giovannonibacteria bacterium GW2011_GWB1_47_6b]KKU85211.1 MAG: MutT/nudix family protein [Parcubacteria group bacterium GW2011_GWA2_47_8b]KKU94999.1 MAG: MutT/nudix family protein [Parcubacteria group bacterium GW2011_GWA1_48_11b]OGY63506.1 MAG: hypothetical protein A3E64_02425 [Candidatus Harrisonbacteria bacterium RIFCSPHIGHO2_12_FULL_48_16]OGY68274.1 MAG: hypothetical protein A2214_02280 [Candidatus Harrisonbacteria bacterium RIFOXYA1_FULL_48_8]
MGTTVFVRLFNAAGERVLLVLNKAETLPNGGKKRQGWGLPGGGVRYGEMPFDAANRELFEEAGVRAEIAPNPCLVVQKSPNQVVIIFDGKNPVGDFLPRDSDILAVDWVSWKFLLPRDKTYGYHRKSPVFGSHVEYIHYQKTRVNRDVHALPRT